MPEQQDDIQESVDESKSGAIAGMPQYKCHKVVGALKIQVVADRLEGGAMLHLEDDGFAPIVVGEAYRHKHDPRAGGYYVVYEDGYESFSPGDVFEAGYTRIK